MSRAMLFSALAFVVLPCAAQRARVDFDHAAQFSCYKTYSWADGPDEAASRGGFPNALMQERIAGLIEEGLAARGLTRVNSGGDLQLRYYLNVSAQPVYNTFYDGPGPGFDGFDGGGWGWGWGGGFSTTTVDVYYEGTLVIELADARKGKMVFTGSRTQSISSKPARNTKRLAVAVDKILEKYPPRP